MRRSSLRSIKFPLICTWCITAAAAAGSEPSVWTTSSLARIYPKSPPESGITYRLIAPRNSRASFQIAFNNPTIHPVRTEVKLVDAGDLNVKVRLVGYVPMLGLTPHTRPEELEGVQYLPGLVPDPLFNETNSLTGSFSNTAYWVTVQVPSDVSPGTRDITLLAKRGNKDDQNTTITASIDVRPFTIQPRKNFPVTHWWRADVLWQHYKVEPWSDDWFRVTEPYIKNMVEHGTNVMFIPAIEGRREQFKHPTQLLTITRDSDRWSFDYSKVRRLVHMAKKNGMEYFEWPHLWLYWGVKHAIPIYLNQPNGTYKRVWSADADGFSPEYLNFMKQYLEAQHKFLTEENILDKSFFHLSDEPNLGGAESIQRYEKARNILREYAPWMKVMDAVSDINYAKKGITDIPVPIVDTAKGYVDAKIPHWVYYCCGPHGDNINRFMDTPLAKIRMSGFLFYKMRAGGFLHWAYNYWHPMDSEALLDTFRYGDAMAWPSIPYGDPFEVYPGPQGPLDSIRWEIFGEALQDYAMLQTAGTARDDPLLAPITNYDRFPKTEEWIRKAVLDVIERKQSIQ